MKLYLQPCDCGERPRHNNGGNYHLRVLVGDKHAAIWDTREAFDSRDGAVVLRHGEELAVLNRAEYIDIDDFYVELDDYIGEGWEILAQPAGASMISIDEAYSLIGPDWHVEEV